MMLRASLLLLVLLSCASLALADEVFGYDVIAQNHNNAVENYHLAMLFSADEATLSQFAKQFTAAQCQKPCNLSLYDEALPAVLVMKYPLRGAEYVRVADHLHRLHIAPRPSGRGAFAFVP